jgi:tetratricopeptide (TPR) repeat protein
MGRSRTPWLDWNVGRGLSSTGRTPSSARAVFGAREAFLLADWYRPDRKERLAAVMEKFPGTDGALLAEQALLQSSDDPVREVVTRLLAFADRHPGTEAARLALDHCGWQLAGVNLIDYGAEDQCLPRLRRLGDVAARLMSGEFPGGEGARAAVGHLASFFLSSTPKTTRASAETMLGAFRTFFASHFLLDAFGEDAVLVDYSLVSKLESLHRALGASGEELPAKVDGELEALEKVLPEPTAIGYLRALRRAGRDEAGASREQSLIEEANGGRLYSRKALAARADLAHAAGRAAEAAELYGRYVERYPGTAYSWLAVLRIGHCRQLAGDSKGAEHAWAAAEKAFPDHPLLAALLPLSRARAAEADGRITDAAKHYRAALEAWPECCAEGLGTPLGNVKTVPRPDLDPDASVSRKVIEARLAELTRPDIAPGDLEQLLTARRFAQLGDVESAARIFEGLLLNRAGSPVAEEATVELVDLRLGAALRDADHAEAHLSRATATGDRFASFAAELFRAFIELRAEDGAEVAAKRLEAALDAWEKGSALREPGSPLEAAVAGVREICFRPHDGTFFRGEWRPERESPYVVLDPAVAVKMADGTETTVTLRQRFPDLSNVLYFTAREVRWIAAIMDGLGGTARTEPGDVMGVPQPQGGSKAAAALLGRFIQVIPGHWGGWHLKTFPRIDEIEFGDSGMTHAKVRFVVRYEGGEADVSARDHEWALTDVRMTWME